LHGKDFGNSELLTGKVPVPAEAKTFVAEVARVKNPGGNTLNLGNEFRERV
jgi:hypothetical protein